MKQAKVLDVAVFLGLGRVPQLNEVDAASLNAARTALVATHPAQLLELVADFHACGLTPRRPAPLERKQP
jgi:hypothetical protein